MLIDTHAHLDYPDFAEDFDDVLARATAAGVTRIITIGTSIKSSQNAVMLAETHANVFAAVGVHPTSADEAPEEIIEPLRELARSPRVVAIGEAGLDYHHLPSEALLKPVPAYLAEMPLNDPQEIRGEILDGAFRSRQAALFEQQLDLAVELGLNVVIHQREAWDDTLAILSAYTGRIRGVFHCFGNSIEQARQVIALNHMVSFTGIVTFKNAPAVHECATHLPEEAFMVETDCPYLAPVPYRGKRCEPAHTRLVAEAIAVRRGQTLESLAAQTTRNAESFFRFDRR
jgi:TatD DNase family protein